MKLRFTYQRPGLPVDLEAVVDSAATVGDLAHALVLQDPTHPYDASAAVTLALAGPQQQVLLPNLPLPDSPVVAGTTLSVVAADGVAAAPVDAAAAVLHVLQGPDTGRSFPLLTGTNYIGRGQDADVQLTDPLVSKRHAKINVGDLVEIIDDNSANGVEIGGAAVTRSPLRSGDQALLGDSLITVERRDLPKASGDPRAATAFVRPPRVQPLFPPEEHALPDFPRRQDPQRFPFIALMTPLLLAAALYAITRQAATLLFVLLSPVMLVGQWAESKWTSRRQYAQAVEQYRQDLQELGGVVAERQRSEVQIRSQEAPSLADLTSAVETRADLMWHRRPSGDDFLALRLGAGRDMSRVQAVMPMSRPADTALWQETEGTVSRWSHVDAVPIVAALRDCGSVGVAAPGEQGAAVARGLAMQVALLHSPAELCIAALIGTGTADRWDWLKWIPHTTDTHSPISADLLAATVASSANLLAELEVLVEERTSALTSAEAPPPLPSVLVVIENDSPAERARLVHLAETGGRAGVHVLWCAPRRADLPAACRVFLSSDGQGQWVAGFADDARDIAPVTVEALSVPDADRVARALAPVIDSGARIDDASDLPRSVSVLSLAGTSFGHDPRAVIERWVESDSLTSARSAPSRRQATLRAVVGQSVGAPLVLDLRSQGPHALVGGTTGAGKSELLQSWVLGMAASHSPERVTFLFVDYKGGSAFAECVDLPHSVGLVTDLSPHLVRRALTSLNAELRHREHVLNAAKAKDLAEMERQGRPDAPPSLVIVVDEFAALAQEVPEFVDGVVNVAQRGRSLGLHLILATQRPAGVIKDNLRANTNLRIALRMADEADSTDILGVGDAAFFDQDAPGRAAVKIGSARLVPFQSGYAGAVTPDAAPAPEVELRELSLTGGTVWEAPADAVPSIEGASDLTRMVSTIRRASIQAEVPQPRRPWLPELPTVVELADLPTERRDASLVLGMQDNPEQQAQPILSFDPDRDGNLAVFGTGGSGKSTVLRSLAVTSALAIRGGPIHIYGLDFGTRGLQMLESLPNVGSIIPGDDAERVARLLSMLRSLIDERSSRFADVQASSIVEYRDRSGHANEPRVLLLLDGFASFRQQYEIGSGSGVFEQLLSIAADGRQVGVHLILTADRPATVPSALSSLVPRRLVLRAADENDLSILGVPRDLFTLHSPPGRGYIDGHEVQVAVLGKSPSVADQAEAVRRLAAAMRKHTDWPDAPDVRRLPDTVRLAELPVSHAELPAFGLEDASLGPIGCPREGTFVVAGPPGSGRTTCVATIVAAHRRLSPDVQLALFAPARSGLANAATWAVLVENPDAAESAAEELQRRLVEAQPHSWIIVIEAPGDFTGTAAENALQDLVKAARTAGQLVVAEGETQSLQGSWGLVSAVRFSRRGIVLQPDQTDGDSLFRTSFPRVRRADFPRGRGLLVQDGRSQRVQVALP
jgi:S-DNA-T family DNA segregation ATPase FtsK/SpoIIIE